MSQIAVQSTNHIMMMEPMDFHANPQTMATNAFQHEDDIDQKDIHERAVYEFRAFRDLLVSHGVNVTTTRGQQGCPDDIFCNNWVSTHEKGRMVLYPMLAENRRTERRKDMKDLLRKMYTDIQDFTLYEQQGKYLESTGAMCMDRINRVVYQAVSGRSDAEIGASWCRMNDYTHIPFETEHKGKPVYHADVVMWIGTYVAGVSSDCLKKKDIIKHIAHKREVVEFTTEQMEAFCGNSLEVVGENEEQMLVMSAAGFKTLNDKQKETLSRYYSNIITPEIPTIEYYGGGSARCMLLELF